MEMEKKLLDGRLENEMFEVYVARKLEAIAEALVDIADDQRRMREQVAATFIAPRTRGIDSRESFPQGIGFCSEHYVPGCEDPGKEPEYLDEHDPPEYIGPHTKNTDEDEDTMVLERNAESNE